MTPLRLSARGRSLTGIRFAGIGLAGIAGVLILLLASASTVAAQTAVTTYHYDTNRTGWNSSETLLTPANVSSSSFALQTAVKLDDQVDAQPLLVPGVNITAGSHQGIYTVVYVVTENDTVYAIDANAGTILL